jgi:hypothetical protein
LAASSNTTTPPLYIPSSDGGTASGMNKNVFSGADLLEKGSSFHTSYLFILFTVTFRWRKFENENI